MKFSLLLILAITLTLNACTTLANRRDLYWPERAHGPWTDKLNKNIEDTIGTQNTRPDSHPPQQFPPQKYLPRD